jgi:hypothetical protein
VDYISERIFKFFKIIAYKFFKLILYCHLFFGMSEEKKIAKDIEKEKLLKRLAD